MPRGDVTITAVYKGEHNLDLVDERPATCTVDGMKRYYVCTDKGCGRKFKDETEAEEITDDSTLVIPKAHKFGAWINEVPATDEATGTKAHKDCEFCGKHFDNDGNEIEDLTLYKTYDVYSDWGTIQADGKTSMRTGGAQAHLEVRAGTVVTIIWEDFRDNSDKVFVKWTYSAVVDVVFDDINSATTTFVMPKGGVSLDCEYKLISTVTIENGTLEGGGTSGNCTEGDTVKITAVAAPEGKEFDKWVVVSGEVTLENANVASTTFVMPASAVEIKATYKDIVEPAPKHNVTIEGGSSSETEIEAGQTVTITAGEAPEGKEFDKWIVVSGEVTLADANSATTTFVMPEGKVEIRATYKDKAPSGGGDNPGGGDTPGGDDTPGGEIEPAKEGGLNGGAIAGIVIASVFAASVAGFAIFWFAIKKKTFADLGAAFKTLFDKIKNSVKKK